MAPPLSADWTTSPAARPRLRGAPRRQGAATRSATDAGGGRNPVCPGAGAAPWPTEQRDDTPHPRARRCARASVWKDRGPSSGTTSCTTCGKSGLPRSGPIQPCQPEPAPKGAAKTLIASAQRAVARGGAHRGRCLAGNLSKPSSVCSTAASLFYKGRL